MTDDKVNPPSKGFRTDIVNNHFESLKLSPPVLNGLDWIDRSGSSQMVLVDISKSGLMFCICFVLGPNTKTKENDSCIFLRSICSYIATGT